MAYLLNFEDLLTNWTEQSLCVCVHCLKNLLATINNTIPLSDEITFLQKGLFLHCISGCGCYKQMYLLCVSLLVLPSVSGCSGNSVCVCPP